MKIALRRDSELPGLYSAGSALNLKTRTARIRTHDVPQKLVISLCFENSLCICLICVRLFGPCGIRVQTRFVFVRDTQLAFCCFKQDRQPHPDSMLMSTSIPDARHGVSIFLTGVDKRRLICQQRSNLQDSLLAQIYKRRVVEVQGTVT